MGSHPAIQDKPQSINSAAGTNPPTGLKQRWPIPIFFIIMAFCAMGLLVAFSLIFQSSSFQPTLEQITLLLG